MIRHRIAAACLVMLVLAASPASAQLPVFTVIERAYTASQPTGGWTTASVNAEYVSWTLPAGVQYSGVSILAALSGVGGIGTGTAYLYSSPGTSGTLTSAATLVASKAVSVTGNVPYVVSTGLFTNVTLSAGSGPVTYYLLLVPSNAFLAWDTSNATSVRTDGGVTPNPDQGATGSVPSPPSGAAWSPLSPNGMLFAVYSSNGNSAPVPVLSPWSLLGLALLLGALGCILSRRQPWRSTLFRSTGLLLAPLVLCHVAYGQVSAQPYAASRVLVKFRTAVGLAANLPTDVSSVFDVAVARPVGGAGAYLLQSKSQSMAALMSGLKARSDVLAVAPDYVISLAATPNDSLFDQLWALPRISAPSAWNVTTGSASSVVGVLDTGLDYTHPDLNANIWSAPSSFTVTIAGRQLTCPAGSHGVASVTDNSGNLTLSCDPQEVASAFYGHGTRVAGIVGAVGNNGAGVVGVNWTASIMGLRMAGNPNVPGCAGGYCGYLSDALNAIEFAIQAGQQFGAQANVRVLSASWGWNQNLYGCGFEDCANAPQMLSDEIARAGSYNMLFVAAAGNGTDDNSVPIDNDTSQKPMYPATLGNTNIISVAATDQNDALASFSNYGAATVHLGAPGVGIVSTIPGGSYGAPANGTSYATPFVSGAAALVLSACPNLDTAGLKAVLLDYVDADSGLAGYTVTGGRLNVSNAVQSCSAASLPSLGFTSGSHLYEASGQITAGSASGFVADASVNPTLSLSFIAGSTIYLLPNFHVKAGASGTVFHASINPQIR